MLWVVCLASNKIYTHKSVAPTELPGSYFIASLLHETTLPHSPQHFFTQGKYSLIHIFTLAVCVSPETQSRQSAEVTSHLVVLCEIENPAFWKEWHLSICCFSFDHSYVYVRLLQSWSQIQPLSTLLRYLFMPGRESLHFGITLGMTWCRHLLQLPQTPTAVGALFQHFCGLYERVGTNNICGPL